MVCTLRQTDKSCIDISIEKSGINMTAKKHKKWRRYNRVEIHNRIKQHLFRSQGALVVIIVMYFLFTSHCQSLLLFIRIEFFPNLIWFVWHRSVFAFFQLAAAEPLNTMCLRAEDSSYLHGIDISVECILKITKKNNDNF